MKRYILPALMGAMTMPLFGQAVVDAVRFGSSNITGTARYRSMAGAFGALGGDPSAMTDNPAGIGIYRGNSEISFTPNLSFSHSKVNGSTKTDNKKADVSVANAAWILSIKTDGDHLVNFNIGLGFNHKEGLRRKYQMISDFPRCTFGDYLANRANNVLWSLDKKPEYLLSDDAWGNPSVPLTALYAMDTYAIDTEIDPTTKEPTDYVINYDRTIDRSTNQQLFVTESNRTDEYNLNVSGNWEDFLYAGLTVSIADLNSTIQSDMFEYYNREDYTQYQNNIETKGNGIGLKAGVLVKPTDTWRVGFAAHTPTWYKMEDLYNGTMETNAPKEDGTKTDPSGGKTYSYKYRYNSPWQMQVSSAWVIAGRALVSAEADFQYFNSQKFKTDDDNWDDGAFDIYKDLFKDYCTIQQTYKVGGEYRLNENWSVRLGYAYKSSPYKEELYNHPDASRSWANGNYGDDNTYLFDSTTKPNHNLLGKQEYYTAGLGWSNEWCHIDFSFMNRLMDEKVAAFPTNDAVKGIDSKGYLYTTYEEDPGYAVRGTYYDLKTRVLTWDITFGMRF